VTDATGAVIKSQLQLTMPNLARTAESAPSEVHFIASVPAMGFTTYFLTPSAPSSSVPTPSPFTPSPSSSPLSALMEKVAARSHLHLRPLSLAPVADPTISNEYWTLTFDGVTGLLSSAK